MVEICQNLSTGTDESGGSTLLLLGVLLDGSSTTVRLAISVVLRGRGLRFGSVYSEFENGRIGAVVGRGVLAACLPMGRDGLEQGLWSQNVSVTAISNEQR
jgi:hypothetical protein